MEISPTETARQTVFGEADVNRASSQAAPSDRFLSKIGAEQADPNIRERVDADSTVDNRTTAQKLLFMDADTAAGEPIDPNAEFERLKAEGVVATKKRNEDVPAP
jgi:hypothetical protein